MTKDPLIFIQHILECMESNTGRYPKPKTEIAQNKNGGRVVSLVSLF